TTRFRLIRGHFRHVAPTVLLRFGKGDCRLSITLIGPGGAGKTTVGALLAARLGIAFIDLDRRFAARAGDISEYITRFGYAAYARENVQTYRSLADDHLQACV